MKISYNWLCNYIDIDVPVNQVAEILTDTGLEVEKVKKIESLPGGLEGLVIGKVLETEKHPNADRLNIAQVNVGLEENLAIVCGAPNLEAGQTVVVAQVGTTVHPNEGDPFKIKRSKIRGVESSGMICGEDEIGLGTNRDGIMVLSNSVSAGTKAKEHFNVQEDYCIEIGLTPNRTDGISHIGVARDLLAALKHKGICDQHFQLSLPNLSDFNEGKGSSISIKVDDPMVCHRYAGVTISGVKVTPSPDWLKERLNNIGLSPINNVVDITNFVLHEYGQPLHAFDLLKISSKQINVKTLSAGTKFTTLDGLERELHQDDLMICNGNEPMCIAGVFGGSDSGISEKTTDLFLESAYFNPVSVRKTAKRHGLNTDASFRFERGVDPNQVIPALQRAALLIVEIAGGTVASEITDLYPQRIENFVVDFSFSKCHQLIGYEIDKNTIKNILQSLDIEIKNENEDVLTLEVPPYRADVQREADVIEEVLRIYGFNNIPLPNKLNSSLASVEKPNREKLKNTVADYLASNGFSEAMSNSLTKGEYHSNSKCLSVQTKYNVEMLNPLSSDLNVMRQSLLHSALETVNHNQNRKANRLKLFEFGKTYRKFDTDFEEKNMLSIVISGNEFEESWDKKSEPSGFQQLKGVVESLLSRIGVFAGPKYSEVKSEQFETGLTLSIAKKKIANLGWVDQHLKNEFDIKSDVLYAELNWDLILELSVRAKVKYKPISKIQPVRRDFSLLIDNTLTFEEIEQIAKKSEQKLLKSVGLFDVYQGKNLPQGKKSYAVSFILQDAEKSLSDKEIDKAMGRIQGNLEKQLNAELR